MLSFGASISRPHAALRGLLAVSLAVVFGAYLIAYGATLLVAAITGAAGGAVRVGI